MIGPAYRYRATVARVVDGDTYHLTLDLGFRASLTVPVRLRGVNTPELGTAAGTAARDFVAGLLAPGAGNLVVETYHDRQSFARWVADVYVNGAPLAELIVDAGHGERIAG